MRGRTIDWAAIGVACDVAPEALETAQAALRPAIAAILREIPKPTPPRRATGPKRVEAISEEASPAVSASRPQRRCYRTRPIIEFPMSRFEIWDEPETLSEALSLHMRRHGDTTYALHRALVNPGELTDRTTIASWRRGTKSPRSQESLELLRRIERRYRLPSGYFKEKLPHPARATVGASIPGIGAAEQRRLAWHLPDDFSQRSTGEQEEILEWVRRVIVSGSTDYRRYQAAAAKTRFGLKFTKGSASMTAPFGFEEGEPSADPEAPAALAGARDAPAALQGEMAALLSFKTATLTMLGYQRRGVWGEETASQKVEHLGLFFGALAASPRGAVRGYGAPLKDLTFGLLIFPSVWDWYVQWRERRRGFYTVWEVDMLSVGLALTRKETGWIRQTPELADRLRPIPGLVSDIDIEAARQDWAGACDALYAHALTRAKEIERVARVHRDPFEPILPVLEAESPVGEYKKITEEVLRLMPDERRHPRAAAEAVRTFLMLRLGLHLGLRQKNLRQLLLCPRGRPITSERRLADEKRGELRWSERDAGWEVLIPSVAFKNAGSSFFGSKPFRLVLPDLGGLYRHIEDYIDRHRAALLAGAPDPGTFFIKTMKSTSRDAAYDQFTFYEAWRWAIQRFGIYNPYTGRGAIPGLLPHGPHNVRDVLATHVLKRTGSYEQASYAIQDTPDMVAKHYGRFLPQDKAALAARVLNQVWEAA
jgi:hypothetical protein